MKPKSLPQDPNIKLDSKHAVYSLCHSVYLNFLLACLLKHKKHQMVIAQVMVEALKYLHKIQKCKYLLHTIIHYEQQGVIEIGNHFETTDSICRFISQSR